MKSFLFGLLGGISLAGLLSAQSLIPATAGNRWVLNSIYTTLPITFSVDSSTGYGTRTVTELAQAYPWASYSLLVSQNTTGVLLEGYSFAGITYWLPEPTSLFKTDAAVGQVWSTPLGNVSLIANNATVNSSLQKFTGVQLYSVGSNAQVWGLKPGFGMVSYTVNNVEFTVSTATSVPYTPLSQQLSVRPCPSAGLTVIPEDTSLSNAQREGALQIASVVGSKNIVIGATWTELEPAQGFYKLSRITNELQLAAKYNLVAVFNLRLPQTTTSTLPGYLAGKTLSDPVVLTRLNALLSRLAAIFPTQLKWVNIGYEVDTYAFMNPSALQAYRTLFDSGRTTLKTLKPGISVGQVFSFDTSRSNNQMFQLLASRGDHVSFTYYALTGTFQQRTPDSPAFDIPLMTKMAGGKPILLVEIGYSSAWAGQPTQAQFFSSAYSTLRKSGGSVAMFSAWSYRDVPVSSVPTLSMQFGQTGPEFSQFVTSTGLVDQYNSPKQAWYTFISEAPAFATTSACTGL